MKISGANLAVVGGLLALSTSLTAQAQIVKCTGKDGRIEFASSCPSGTKQMDTGVSNRPAPAPAPAATKEGAKDGKEAKENPAAPKSLTDRDAEFRKRQAAQKEADSKAAQKTAEDAERQRVCQAAQSNLRALKDRQRMHRSDPKTGERVAFEESDYQREIPVTERLVAENCKP
jgi:hypothetical protein